MNKKLNDVITSFDDEPVLHQDVDESGQQDENTPSGIDADSEPDTETNTEDQPKAGNKLQERLDKLTTEKYAEKRRADELAAKIAELERAKPVQLGEDLQEPVMPDDIFDADAMRKYHSEMAQYNRKLAVHEAKALLNNTASEQKALQQQTERRQIVQEFAKRTLTAGYTIDQIEQAGTALVNAGLNQELQLMLLEDDAGPQITMYLVKNPDAAQELLTMPTHKASVAIATKIKAQAVKTKARATNAPDPIPETRGASLVDSDENEKFFKNAKFI